MKAFIVRRVVERSQSAEQFILVEATNEEEAVAYVRDNELDIEDEILEENEFPDMISEEVSFIEIASEEETERFLAATDDVNETFDDLDDFDEFEDLDDIDSWDNDDEPFYDDALTFDED